MIANGCGLAPVFCQNSPCVWQNRIRLPSRESQARRFSGSWNADAMAGTPPAKVHVVPSLSADTPKAGLFGYSQTKNPDRNVTVLAPLGKLASAILENAPVLRFMM